MGLVYNHKNKLDLIVLSEEKLEKNEGELCSFVVLPDEEEQQPQEEGGNRLGELPSDGNA